MQLGLRRHRRTTEHVVTRTCIACGRKAPKAHLRRLAVLNGCVVSDPNQVLPGRGAYACPSESCQAYAISDRRGCLERAFRRPIGQRLSQR